MILAVLFLIYGSDTRLDAYEVDDPSLQDLIGRSVILYEGSFDLQPLSARHELCEEERFRDQPTLPACSGVLLDAQRVLTAGHCVRACAKLRLAKNFAQVQATQLAELEHYACQEILERNEALDLAIFLIDRPVANLPPVPTATAVVTGEHLFSIGHPLGLPVKLDLDGRAERIEGDQFCAALDLYQGSSGSGIYNDRLELAGIAVRGQSDFQLDPQELCLRSRTATVGEELISRPVFERTVLEPETTGCTCTQGHSNLSVLALSMGALLLRARRRSFRSTSG